MMYPSRTVGNFQTVKLSIDSFCKAAYRAFNKYVKSCDIIYAHFINMAGIAASYISERENIPSVTASGESDLQKNMNVYRLYQKEIYGIDGFITVSTLLKKNLLSMNIIKNDAKIRVLPNAVDLSVFKKENQQEARKEIGMPQDVFTVVFVGHFIERKGFKTLIDAAKMSEDWKCIFIGSENNTESVTYDKTLFRGRLSHDKLGTYMSASDVFVLPTRAEGCCNAIIEALASKLPVVSSDLPFNDDILDESCSIRINPESEKEVFDAVEKLRMNKVLCEKMSNAALKKAQTMSIQNRAERILDFMFGSR